MYIYRFPSLIYLKHDIFAKKDLPDSFLYPKNREIEGKSRIGWAQYLICLLEP